MISPELPSHRNDVAVVFVLCCSSLVGFVLFLISFPIYRRIPFWPHLSIAELFLLWFLFVAPVTTAIAFVVFIRRKRFGSIVPVTKWLAWTAITLSVLADLFMLLGLWAPTT